MQPKNTVQFVNKFWKDSVIPALSDFVRIPCKSPDFDSNWQKNGHLLKAAKLMAAWVEAQKIPGLKSKVIQDRGKGPLLYVEIPGQVKNSVLFYGHLDKMPEAEGWNKGFGPWQPVIKGDRIYGRGTVDDGYAFFSYISAIKALAEQKIPYSRCVIIIEAGEEVGSPDMPYYFKKLRPVIGKIDLVVCFDLTAGDYERLWITTSLRGRINCNLTAEVLKTAVHSGVASGIVPSSFRILRQLIARLEDADTGKILLKSCYNKIPKMHQHTAQALVKFLGKKLYTALPLAGNTQPLTKNIKELILNQFWRPFLCTIGARGFPDIQDAGNAMRPFTTLQLSLRVPPLCDPMKITKELEKLFTSNPPYGAKVKFEFCSAAAGWAATSMQPWLDHALNTASKTYFGKPSLKISEGGSIGVITLLHQAFPNAQFVLTGVSGPHSNEHGPNESLCLPAAQKLACCLANILKEQYLNAKK